MGSLIGFCPYAGAAPHLLVNDVGLPFPAHQKPAGCEQHALLAADVYCDVSSIDMYNNDVGKRFMK